jgi:hypothetical protein
LPLILLLLGVARADDNQEGLQNRVSCLQRDSFGLCTKCNYEYYLQDNLCYLCSNACKSCASPTTCSQCMKGYRLNAEGGCDWILFDLMLLFNIFFITLLFVTGIMGWLFASKQTLLMDLAGDSVGKAKKEEANKSPQQTSIDEDKLGYSSIKDL